MTTEERQLLKTAYLIIRLLPITQRNQAWIDKYQELERQRQREEQQLKLWNGAGDARK